MLSNYAILTYRILLLFLTNLVLNRAFYDTFKLSHFTIVFNDLVLNRAFYDTFLTVYPCDLFKNLFEPNTQTFFYLINS